MFKKCGFDVVCFENLGSILGSSPPPGYMPSGSPCWGDEPRNTGTSLEVFLLFIYMWKNGFGFQKRVSKLFLSIDPSTLDQWSRCRREGRRHLEPLQLSITNIITVIIIFRATTSTYFLSNFIWIKKNLSAALYYTTNYLQHLHLNLYLKVKVKVLLWCTGT